MSLIDETEEWEKSLSENREGDVKFPISFLDREVISSIGEVTGNLQVKSPRIKDSKVKEIKLGKKSINKNKGNKLF